MTLLTDDETAMVSLAVRTLRLRSTFSGVLQAKWDALQEKIDRRLLLNLREKKARAALNRLGCPTCGTAAFIPNDRCADHRATEA
jgi:hypothetical protein